MATRWGVTPQTIRNMVKRGELRAFRLGPKLLRIPAEEVQRHECRTSPTNLSVIEENSRSVTEMRMDSEGALRSARLIAA